MARKITGAASTAPMSPRCWPTMTTGATSSASSPASASSPRLRTSVGHLRLLVLMRRSLHRHTTYASIASLNRSKKSME